MSKPRPVLPRLVWMSTRRTSQRAFLLAPNATTADVVAFCLFEAAAQYGLEVCAVVAMSNHYHALLIDWQGQYPRFLCRFHAHVAKVQNARYGRWENLWAGAKQTSMVRCVAPEDAFAQMIYILTNPVRAHLVARAADWPGLTSLPAQRRDKTDVVRRPRWFFAREGSVVRDEVEIHYRRLPGFEHLSEEAWRAKIDTAVAEVEADAAAERARNGTRVVGRRALRQLSYRDRPQTREPRRQMSPRIACRDKLLRIAALEELKRFEDAYRRAWQNLQAGERAVFPVATWRWTRWRFVACEPPSQAA
ncbi:MAG: hypothetical protein AAGA56_28180 [Myxococcota bacterium]